MNTHVTPEIEIRTRRAPASASTYNAETSTFDVDFATTGASVSSWDREGAYIELLDVNGFTLSQNVMLLDAHDRGSMASVLGVVLSAKTVGREARATCQLSRNNDLSKRLGADMADGMKFAVSVGYTVEKWESAVDAQSGVRTKTAKQWTVREISLVPIPADPNASTRNHPMPEQHIPAPAPATPAQLPIEGVAAPITPEAIATRAAVNTEIRTICRAANLPQTQIDGLIDRAASADDARRAAADELVRRSNAAPAPHHRAQVGTDYTDPEIRARSMGEALYARMTPGHALSEQARQFSGMTIHDMAREALTFRSVPLTGLSSVKLIERALHTTADFPLLLGDATGRTLRATYLALASGLKPLGRQVNAGDFRMRHRLQLSAGGDLEPLGESGEVKSGTLAEAKESYKLSTYAKRVGISRHILVNDDLGAFADIGRRMAQGAANTEANLLAALLNANSGGGQKMADGKNLFHTDHGNLSTGAAIGEVPLSAMRQAMRKQTDVDGKSAISVTPKYLLVPAELETAAEKLVTQITPATTDAVNVFTRLVPVVEPRLVDTNGYYLVADPAETDGLEWSYLDGEEGPQIETRAGFEIEGVEIKVRLDFGAGFVDHRSWHRNPGV